jgi:hypothetical protein
VKPRTFFTEQEKQLIDVDPPANAEPMQVLQLAPAIVTAYIGAQLVIVGETQIA